jgi:hypothetical protein
LTGEKKLTNLAQDLQALEAHLQQVIQSPGYRDLVASGCYQPDFTLIDALHAVREAEYSREAASLLGSVYEAIHNAQ